MASQIPSQRKSGGVPRNGREFMRTRLAGGSITHWTWDGAATGKRERKVFKTKGEAEVAAAEARAARANQGTEAFQFPTADRADALSRVEARVDDMVRRALGLADAPPRVEDQRSHVGVIVLPALGSSPPPSLPLKTVDLPPDDLKQ